MEKSPKLKVADLGEHLNKYQMVEGMPRTTELTDLILEPICIDQLLTDSHFVNNELAKYEAAAYASQGSGFNLQPMP